MILLINTKSTRPLWRRFPLSVMALGAVLPAEASWEIWDGNKPEPDFLERVIARVAATQESSDPVTLLAFSVMPGPQLVSAAETSRSLKERFPEIPIAWGGYFPSLYPKPVLDAHYVDWVIRGQGERTLVELLEVVEGRRDASRVAGLAFCSEDRVHRINPDRPWTGPNDFPSPPYHRIDVGDYLGPTALGRRSGVYQASIGCPYQCSFCGVISVYGGGERFEDPARTAANLDHLVSQHGMDSVHFYDNNFFLKESHAEELCDRLAPLHLNWWCETRIDGMLRFSDATWRKIERAGARMIFFGAESGSDAALQAMKKKLTTTQTLEIAERLAHTSIVPEFSFMLGGPDDPEEDIGATLNLIRKLKQIDPRCEIVFHYYTPMPRSNGEEPEIAPTDATPTSIEEWCEPAWVDWMTFEKPRTPWMNRRLWKRVANFQLVLESPFPSLHSSQINGWRRKLVQRLARRRWDEGRFKKPLLLRAARTWLRHRPEDSQAYGHLRPPEEAGPALSPRNGYRLWAATYEGPNGMTHLDELAVERLSPRNFSHLVDAGCGTGWRLPPEETGSSIGVDLSTEMLAIGRARGETRLLDADIRTLPFQAGAFDLLWCRLVLSHLVDAGKAYLELGRTASAAASLIVTDMHVDAVRAGFRTSFMDPSGRTRFIQVHMRTLDDHARLAADAGFELEDMLEYEIGPEIRQLFESAGARRLYERHKGHKVLLAMRFIKRSGHE